ncbi:gp53-like domain-containing protein [Sphingomonas zeae]
MTALTLMITRGGQSRFTAAQLDADINLGIASIGLTDRSFVSSPTLDKLPGEFKRITSISGDQVGDDIVHLMIRDDSADHYTARGFGLFLADGTLFATYAQADQLFEKSARAVFSAAVDIVFPTGDISELTFGDTNFLQPPATTERKGVVELATEAEALAGTDTARVASVAILAKVLAALEARIGAAIKAAVDNLADAIWQALDGLAQRTIYGSGLVKGGGRNDTNRTLTVDAATSAEIRTGTAGDKAITPAGLRGAYTSVLEAEGYRVHPDGFIEMWGRAARPGVEGEFTLNFPFAFPYACFGVVPMTVNTNKSVDGQTTIQEVALYPDRAVLFVQNHQTTSNEAGGFRWRAWGR